MISKVIFCGFPFKLDEETNELKGFWLFLFPILKYATDGHGWMFMTYTGSYFKALKYWLQR